MNFGILESYFRITRRGIHEVKVATGKVNRYGFRLDFAAPWAVRPGRRRRGAGTHLRAGCFPLPLHRSLRMQQATRELAGLGICFLGLSSGCHRAVPALGWPRYLQSGALNWAKFTSQLLVVLERPDEHASFRSAKERPCGGIGRTRETSLCRAELVAPPLAGQQTDSWSAHSRRLGNQIHLLLDGDEDAKHALCDRTVHGQAAPGDCTCDPDDAW